MIATGEPKIVISGAILLQFLNRSHYIYIPTNSEHLSKSVTSQARFEYFPA
jgi:hypothetical protein